MLGSQGRTLGRFRGTLGSVGCDTLGKGHPLLSVPVASPCSALLLMPLPLGEPLNVQKGLGEAFSAALKCLSAAPS